MSDSEMKMSSNCLMVNGEFFEEGEIDVSVIASLRKIKRFPSFSIPDSIRCNVTDHLWLCGVLVPKYCDFMTEWKDGRFKETYNDVNFRYMLMQALLSHDLEEIILNDIPAPVKLPGLEELKDNIRSKFRKFLNFNVIPDANAIIAGVKHLDSVTAVVEIYLYNQSYMTKKLKKNFTEYYCKKISDWGIGDFFQILGDDIYKFWLEQYSLHQK